MVELKKGDFPTDVVVLEAIKRTKNEEYVQLQLAAEKKIQNSDEVVSFFLGGDGTATSIVRVWITASKKVVEQEGYEEGKPFPKVNGKLVSIVTDEVLVGEKTLKEKVFIPSEWEQGGEKRVTQPKVSRNGKNIYVVGDKPVYRLQHAFFVDNYQEKVDRIKTEATSIPIQGSQFESLLTPKNAVSTEVFGMGD